MPDPSIIFSVLLSYQSEDGYEKARTDNAADDASDDAVKADSDKAEKRARNGASDDSEKDIDDDAVVALHYEACDPSADCADQKRYDQIN